MEYPGSVQAGWICSDRTPFALPQSCGVCDHPVACLFWLRKNDNSCPISSDICSLNASVDKTPDRFLNGFRFLCVEHLSVNPNEVGQ